MGSGLPLSWSTAVWSSKSTPRAIIAAAPPTLTVSMAEQGHWMHRPGQATVEVVGPREAIETVKVGGAAAMIVRGELEM